MQLADAFEVEATKPSTEVIVSGKVLVHCSNDIKKNENCANYYFGTMQDFFTAFN